MLEGLPQLALTDDVLGTAAVLVRELVMPGPAAEGDALHVAVTLVHQMDHLVTWNQRHLAELAQQAHSPSGGLPRLGYLLPEIVTPDLMIYGEPP